MFRWVIMLAASVGFFAFMVFVSIGNTTAFNFANQAVSWRLFASVLFFFFMWIRLKKAV